MIEMHGLDGKKVIVCGDERYVRDFLYVFSNIKPEKIIFSNDTEYYRLLENVIMREAFIILCEYDEQNTVMHLCSLGYKRGYHFISAETCFKWLDFPIEEISSSRNLYIWGTGVDSYKFFIGFLEKKTNIHIVGFLDSDKRRQGESFFGYPIYSPESIKNDVSPFVIVATKKYYADISSILKKWGLKSRRDYISFVAINSYASELMRKTIFDIPKISYLCPKPFKAFELKPEGRSLICGGMFETYDKVEPMYYSEFSHIWHSNILKVVRLSCVNGTYSFCNPIICNYIRESGMASSDVNDIRNKYEITDEKIAYLRKKKKYSQNTVLNVSNYSIKEGEYPCTLQIGFDESCNLCCPSCRKHIYVASSEKNEELHDFKRRIYKEILDNVDRIKVAGLGEAFASVVYREILFDKDLANKIGKLGILTNGSLLFPETFNKLSELWADINVFVSMDGAKKETMEKLRAGVNYDVWKKNMKYIGEMRRQGRIKKLAFNYVVQRENYKEMPEFIDLVQGFNADQIKFSMVTNWGNWSSEEFSKVSMIDEYGNMKPELKAVVDDDRFEDEKVYLFRWVDW